MPCFTEENEEWKRLVQGSTIYFINGANLIALEFQSDFSELSEDATKVFCLTPLPPWDTICLNNLAYLLRRKELISIRYTYSDKYMKEISPDMLLLKGKEGYEIFSSINYALFISSICINDHGNYDAGKEYLHSIKDHLIGTATDQIQAAIMWWKKLALERSEYEGIVVLSWLYELEMLDLNAFEKQVQRSLYFIAMRLDTDNEFGPLVKALRVLLDNDSDLVFEAKDEDGTENEYKMLLVKQVDGKSILWYTDDTKDEEDRQNIYVSEFSMEDGTLILKPIDDSEMEKYITIFMDDYS